MKLRLIKKNEASMAGRLIARAFSDNKYRVKAQKEIEAMFLNHAVKPKYIVAEEKGEILGLAGFSQSWMDYGIYEIFWVAVDPRYQKRGTGKSLVEEVVRIIKKKKGVSLILLTTEYPAFYKKVMGFKIFVKLSEKNYYLMKLEI
ncbi:MAG: GNAT family N-acetyltransferase [Patescibacteria group bacterium]